MPDRRRHVPANGDLAAVFRDFAHRRCDRYAPLYAQLGAGIAGDPDLLTLAANAAPGQSAPDLMLAAVHYLLASEPGHPLACHYPTLADSPISGGAFPLFRHFCMQRRSQLTQLIGTRYVQTNEVRRCCYLLPAVMLAAQLAGRPLALIEPGTSAGLNLTLDSYAYDYGPGLSFGEPAAPLILRCRLRGHQRLPPNLVMPRIGWRAGIDLHPLQPTDPGDAAWLRALVWADHRERAALLDSALTVAAAAPAIPVHAGEAAEVLPRLVTTAPAELAVCIFHTAFLAHLPRLDRQRFEHLIAVLSAVRPIYWVQAEPLPDPADPRLRLTICQDGQITGR